MEIGQSADRFHGTPRAVTPSNPSYAEKLAEARVQHADAVAAQACSEWERRHRRDPECIRAATGALTALADRMGEATQQH